MQASLAQVAGATDLDHRDAAVGLCRVSRAVCESMAERWRDGAGSLPTLGIRSHRCLHTSGRGHTMGQILDHRETAMGLCRLSRAVWESVGGRWRDGAGSLPTLGIGSHRCLHTSGRGRAVGQIFDHRETVMGAALAGAHSLRESRRAMARRRRQFAGLGYPGHTDACTHVGAGGRWDRFSTIEKR